MRQAASIGEFREVVGREKKREEAVEGGGERGVHWERLEEGRWGRE